LVSDCLRWSARASIAATGLFAERSGFLTIQQSFAFEKTHQFREICVGTTHALGAGRGCLDQGDWNMKIEVASQRGKTTVRLSGQFQAEQIAELKKQFLDNGPSFVLDLTEVTVVDVEVVRFFGACEANGAKIVHCPRYIREWINREREP
jgi:hypothetical protein